MSTANSNNIEEPLCKSEDMQGEFSTGMILNDVLPSMADTSEEEEEQSPYGSWTINSKQNITAYVDSHIGGRKENQDSAGFKDTALGAVIVVCDGMGGMYGGQKASSLAVTTILETINSAPSGTDRKRVLVKAIKAANENILAYGAEHPSYAGMGTTVTAIIMSDQSVVAAFVGDSRIYQLRGKRKVFRTFDHSMVFEMVRRKALTEEQARLSAQSNVILKALGVSANVEPEVFELPYQKGDRFILCSDGFWGAMPEEEFLSCVSRKGDVDKVLSDMMVKVHEIGCLSGGKHDNLTAAFVDVKNDSKLKEKMNKTAKITIAALAACLLVSLIFNIIPDKKTDEPAPVKEDSVEVQVQQPEKFKEFAFGYAFSEGNTFTLDGVKCARIYTVQVDFDGGKAILKYIRSNGKEVTLVLPSTSVSNLSIDTFAIMEQLKSSYPASTAQIDLAYYLENEGNHFAVVRSGERYYLWISNSKPILLNTVELNK